MRSRMNCQERENFKVQLTDTAIAYAVAHMHPQTGRMGGCACSEMSRRLTHRSLAAEQRRCCAEQLTCVTATS